MKLRLLSGGEEKPKKQGNFVCTWCAATFHHRQELVQHRIDSPACRRNQGVSNQTQTKYNSPGQAITVHGEEILRRVRSGNCDHISHQEITGTGGQLIALQCLTCYTYLPVPQAPDDGNPVDAT